MKLRGLDHVWFWVTDMDRSVRYYEEQLGLGLRVRHGDEWAELEAGAIHIGLHGARSEGNVPHGGTAVFRVDDLDLAKTALEQRGVGVPRAPRRGAGHRALRIVRRPRRQLDAVDRVRPGEG